MRHRKKLLKKFFYFNIIPLHQNIHKIKVDRKVKTEQFHDNNRNNVLCLGRFRVLCLSKISRLLPLDKDFRVDRNRYEVDMKLMILNKCIYYYVYALV